jgi:hypothetical protein
LKFITVVFLNLIYLEDMTLKGLTTNAFNTEAKIDDFKYPFKLKKLKLFN